MAQHHWLDEHCKYAHRYDGDNHPADLSCAEMEHVSVL